MALLNRLFSSRKKTQRQGYGTFSKNDKTSWTPFNFSKDQVRVLLFRECDWRGRRLLFDSLTVRRILIDNHVTCKSKVRTKEKPETKRKSESFIEISNGYGYQYLKESTDVAVLGEMIFGSVAMSFKGTAFKVHCMKSPDRIMCTKVFHSPRASRRNKRSSDRSLDDSFGSSMSSTSQHGISVCSESTNGSRPLDVPYFDGSSKVLHNSLEVDSGFCGEASLESVSSLDSVGWSITCQESKKCSDSMLGSFSIYNSGSSLASLHRRWLRNLSTSLEVGSSWTSGRDKHSESLCHSLNEDEGPVSTRKAKLGLAIIINLTSNEEKSMELFLFEHMGLVETMLDRLTYCVENAYKHKDSFLHIMMDGYLNVQQWILDLFCAPRIQRPVWLSLRIHRLHGLHQIFLQDFCQLIATLDTKPTNFFISTLLTAILTHHLGWVCSVMPVRSDAPNFCKATSHIQLVESLSRSHPYNAFWAQLGDLYGALGKPTKVARTVVTGGEKKISILNKILNSMSYFIRCATIEKVINDELSFDIIRYDGVDDSNLNYEVKNESDFDRSSNLTLKCENQLDYSTDFKANNSKNGLLNKSLSNNLSNFDYEHSNDPAVNSTNSNLIGNATCDKSNVVLSHKNSQLKTPIPHPEIALTNNNSLISNTFENDSSKLNPSNTSVGLKRSPSCIQKLENSIPRLYPNISDFNLLEDSMLQLLEENESVNSLLDPVCISEKVSKLCRVPSNALQQKVETELFQEVLHKKVDIERQMAAPHDYHKLKSEIVSPSRTASDKVYFEDPKIMTQNVQPVNHQETNDKCVIFVLGENEELVGLKTTQQSTRHKRSKSNDLQERKIILDRNHSINSSNFGLMTLGDYAYTNKSRNETLHNKTDKKNTILDSFHKINTFNQKENIEPIEIENHIVRSQSLSYPSHKFSDKKSFICRRHSDLNHMNDLKYFSYGKINIDKSNCLLSNYLNGRRKEKCYSCDSMIENIIEPSEPLQHSNFLKHKVSNHCCIDSDSVHNNSTRKVCECNKNVMVPFPSTEESSDKPILVNCKNSSVIEVCEEGNALFDDYSYLSDDEQPDTPVVKERQFDNQWNFISQLKEIPLPRDLKKRERETNLGVAGTLLGGVSDHYIPDFVIQGCTQLGKNWEQDIRRDLYLAAYHPVLDQEISEAVCILANLDMWEVQVISSHKFVVDRSTANGVRVGMSQLIANMLESLLQLWKLKTSPEHCLLHLESKLHELCLRSQTLAEFLLSNDFCDMKTLTSSLDLEANDIPLLLAVASTHTPEVTQRYGLSFR